VYICACVHMYMCIHVYACFVWSTKSNSPHLGPRADGPEHHEAPPLGHHLLPRADAALDHLVGHMTRRVSAPSREKIKAPRNCHSLSWRCCLGLRGRSWACPYEAGGSEAQLAGSDGTSPDGTSLNPFNATPAWVKVLPWFSPSPPGWRNLPYQTAPPYVSAPTIPTCTLRTQLRCSWQHARRVQSPRDETPEEDPNLSGCTLGRGIIPSALGSSSWIRTVLNYTNLRRRPSHPARVAPAWGRRWRGAHATAAPGSTAAHTTAPCPVGQ
jgi:hypothetical protein